MKLSINISGTPTPEDSFKLTGLGELLERELRQNVSFQKGKQKGTKNSGGLVLGIEIAKFILSGVTTLLALLLYWKSQHPKYSITLKRNDYTVKIENLTTGKIKDVINKIESHKSSSNLEVIISKG